MLAVYCDLDIEDMCFGQGHAFGSLTIIYNKVTKASSHVKLSVWNYYPGIQLFATFQCDFDLWDMNFSQHCDTPLHYNTQLCNMWQKSIHRQPNYNSSLSDDLEIRAMISGQSHATPWGIKEYLYIMCQVWYKSQYWYRVQSETDFFIDSQTHREET